MPMTWPEVVVMLRAAAEKRGGRVFVRDAMMVLSTEGQGVSITVRDAGEDGVFIEAGWVVRLAAECEDHEDEPPYCLQVIEAIMDGNAEEAAIIDPDGSWIDTAFTIRSPHHGTTGGQPDARPRVTRRFPAWN